MRARDYPFDTVIIRCDRCNRLGKYSKANFIEKVGRDTHLPVALGMIAKDCPRADQPINVLSNRCMAHYPDLSKLNAKQSR